MSEAVHAPKAAGNGTQRLASNPRTGGQTENSRANWSVRATQNGVNGVMGGKSGQKQQRKDPGNGPRKSAPKTNANQGKPRGAGPKASGSAQPRHVNMKGLSLEQYVKIGEVRQSLQAAGYNALEDDVIHALKQNNFDSTITAQKMKDARQNSWSALVSKNIKTKLQVEKTTPSAPTASFVAAPAVPPARQLKPSAPETGESAEQRAQRLKSVSDKVAELTREYESMRSGTSEYSQLQQEQKVLETRKAELTAEIEKIQLRLGDIQAKLVDLRKQEERVLGAIKETSRTLANL